MTSSLISLIQSVWFLRRRMSFYNHSLSVLFVTFLKKIRNAIQFKKKRLWVLVNLFYSIHLCLTESVGHYIYSHYSLHQNHKFIHHNTKMTKSKQTGACLPCVKDRWTDSSYLSVCQICPNEMQTGSCLPCVKDRWTGSSYFSVCQICPNEMLSSIETFYVTITSKQPKSFHRHLNRQQCHIYTGTWFCKWKANVY